jgi:hypothetical protein
MRPAEDTRAAEARQRLAECPADPQILTVPHDELARRAVRATLITAVTGADSAGATC